MAGVDSNAVFVARAGELGLSAFVNTMSTLGMTTMNEMAFSINYTPGNPDDTNLFEELIVPVLESREHVKKAALKRLFFEAYALEKLLEPVCVIQGYKVSKLKVQVNFRPIKF